MAVCTHSLRLLLQNGFFLTRRDAEILKLTPLKLSGVPPPMAHNELELDSNIIDVSFSKSNSRLAILMKDSFSVFRWSTKTRPVPLPILESTYPLPNGAESRPRQIAFLNENEVYILRDQRPNKARIERTILDKNLTDVTYESTEFEQLYSIFSTLGHEELYMSHTVHPGNTISYSSIAPSPAGGFEITAWDKSPTANTYWAGVVRISDEKVLVIRTSNIVLKKKKKKKKPANTLIL